MALTRTIDYREAFRLDTASGPIVLHFCRSRRRGRDGQPRDQINIEAPVEVSITRIPWTHEERRPCPPPPTTGPPTATNPPGLMARASSTPRPGPPLRRSGARSISGGSAPA